ALSSLLVVCAAFFLWAFGRLPADTPLALESGVASRTGFSVSTLWYVPLVAVQWSWIEPRATVTAVRVRRRWVESVTANRRGFYERIVRRVEVRDAFGFGKIAFNLRQTRRVRVWPSTGALRQVEVLRSVATGDDVSNPAGRPAGDRVDLRRYAPGDPMRL